MRTLKLKNCPRVHSLRFTPDGRRVLVIGGVEAMTPDVALWLDPAGGETARWPLPPGLCAVDHGLKRLVVLIDYDLDRPGEVCGVAELVPDEVPVFAPLPLVRRIMEWLEGGVATGLALSADGNQLAFRFHGQWEWAAPENELTRVVVWRIKPAKRLAEFRVETSHGRLGFTPDGARVVAIGGEDDSIAETLTIATGERVSHHASTNAQVLAFAIAEDGRLAIASGRKVFVFPPGSSDPALTLKGHKGQVNTVAFSPDGTRLMSASHDGAIRVWDSHSGEEVTAFDWKIGPVTAVAVAPDGLTAIAAGKGGQVVVWDLEA